MVPQSLCLNFLCLDWFIWVISSPQNCHSVRCSKETKRQSRNKKNVTNLNKSTTIFGIPPFEVVFFLSRSIYQLSTHSQGKLPKDAHLPCVLSSAQISSRKTHLIGTEFSSRGGSRWQSLSWWRPFGFHNTFPPFCHIPSCFIRREVIKPDSFPSKFRTACAPCTLQVWVSVLSRRRPHNTHRLAHRHVRWNDF